MTKKEINILDDKELMTLIDQISMPIVDGVDFTSDEEEDDLDDDMGQGGAPVGGNEKTTQRRNVIKNDNATPTINKYGKDITRQAAAGELDPVVGRERQIERLAQILSRRKKNNPVLIGEPGVGKSAIVEGLAQRIVERKVFLCRQHFFFRLVHAENFNRVFDAPLYCKSCHFHDLRIRIEFS